MKNKILIIILAGLLLYVSAFFAQPARVGTTYYVAISGNDANAGTQIAPWKTIQKAENTMSAGDTVIVSSGTYNERLSVTRSGLASLPITFRARGIVVMQGFKIPASYIKIDGFEIANTPGSSWRDRANGSGVYLSGSNNILNDNYIHNTPAAGIYLAPSANNNTISRNRIAYPVECGIYIQGSNNLIDSNDISHSRGIEGSDADGIRFFGSGNTVKKNYIHDIMLSDSPGQSPHIDAFQTWGPATNYIFEQNLIDKDPSQQQGFTIEGLTQPVRNITIRNNIFISRGTGYQPDVNSGDIGIVTDTTIVNNTMIATNGAAEYVIWLFANQRGAIVKNNTICNHGNSGAPYIKTDVGSSGLDIASNSLYETNSIICYNLLLLINK